MCSWDARERRERRNAGAFRRPVPAGREGLAGLAGLQRYPALHALPIAYHSLSAALEPHSSLPSPSAGLPQGRELDTAWRTLKPVQGTCWIAWKTAGAPSAGSGAAFPPPPAAVTVAA